MERRERAILPAMHRRSSVLLGGLVSLLVACSSTPPVRWQEGGAALAIGPARWQRGSRVVAELRPDGIVEERGRETFFIDAAGRVADQRREPVAVLLPDGLVAGVDDLDLGRVGVSNASPPGSTYAWLALMPDGTVMRFDSDGDRQPDGAWTGCSGPVLRTCTLITHLIALRGYRHHGGPIVGVGVGIGF